MQDNTKGYKWKGMAYVLNSIVNNCPNICKEGETCVSGVCQNLCGSDGCNGNCGSCSLGKICNAGKCENVVNKLVAYYQFEGNANDSSGNSNNGVVNGATLTTVGKIGRAYNFDGISNYISVQNSKSLSPKNQMTMSAWVYPKNISGKRRDIIYGDPGYFLGIDPSGNAVAYINNGTWNPVYPTSGKIPLNQWSHISATYNGNQLILYVNGNKVGTLAITGSISTPGKPIKIGSQTMIYGGNREDFQGTIDEVKIWNYALSESEIKIEYNRRNA